MATSLEDLQKEVRIKKIQANTFHMVKDRENRLVDAEIYSVDLKKERRNFKGKIYSSVGKFAERAKKNFVVQITILSALYGLLW